MYDRYMWYSEYIGEMVQCQVVRYNRYSRYKSKVAAI